MIDFLIKGLNREMIDFTNLASYKKVPNQEDGACFACSPINEKGLKMKFYTDEESVFSSLQVPAHLCGWSNVVHGGVTTTILDETIAWTVIYLRQSYMLTKALNVEFLQPLFVGKEIHSIGKIIETKSKREVIVEASVFNHENTLAAKAIGNIILFSPEQIRKRKIFPENFLADFEEKVFGK